MTTSYYRKINSITQLYLYAWNNCVVIIICGRNNEHGRDNKFNRKVDIIIDLHTNLFRHTYPTNTITYNNQARYVISYHTTIHLPQLIWFNPAVNSYQFMTTTTTTSHNWWWHRWWHTNWQHGWLLQLTPYNLAISTLFIFIFVFIPFHTYIIVD